MIQDADIFIVIGTSLVVYPVAGLVHEIPANCQAYYIDPKAMQAQLPAQFQRISKTATEGVQQLFDQLHQV